MAKFKKEYENCNVTVNAHGIGRVTINTSTANPESWSKIPEFEFMFEQGEKAEAKQKYETKVDHKKENKVELNIYDLQDMADDEFTSLKLTLKLDPGTTKKELIEKSDNVDYSKFKLSFLRELFPDVKATSVKKFVEELNG